MRFPVILLALLSVPLAAQTVDIGGVTPAMDPSAIAHGILISNLPRQADGSMGRGSLAAASHRAAPTRTDYRPDATVSAKVARQLVAQAEQRTPGAGAEMQALIRSGKARSEYRRVAAGLGLSPNDAADALAFYLVAQWGVANDYRRAVTRAQMAGVRRQVRAAFPASLDTDAERQVLAETLSTQGVVMAGIHEARVATGDRGLIEQIVGMAREGGRQVFGTDPRRFQLTDDGLVPAAS